MQALKHVKLSGFTLIELLVTLAILSVLATLSVPVMQVANQRIKEKELRLALREIRTAIDAYKRAYDDGKIMNSPLLSGYPTSLDILVNGVPNQRDPLHHKLYFLRKIPADPMLDNEQSEQATWGLRSYDSDTQNPRDGVDVYDIYSTSEKVSLNGQAYKKW
ncbi:type II secretion system protein [Undibacterium flavidum]|uniref:Type II secretion system protein n=1 Tax=Undibacterium flavidum TaxID=2762297 RepID=A0ABR6YEB0_9BURK|nr:type II secretion system protein [Undibacterium flavidum]MBC3874899.1 type II secretion system protein [Undibacterium flavidum]